MQYSSFCGATETLLVTMVNYDDTQQIQKFKTSFDIDSDNVSIDLRNAKFIDNTEHLNCPICQQPFIKPMTTICGHTFCKDCIIECINMGRGGDSTDGNCPLDRTPLNKLNIHDLFPTPLLITNMVDELKVDCLNLERGCAWIGPRWKLEHHVILECGYTGVCCNGIRHIVSETKTPSVNEDDVPTNEKDDSEEESPEDDFIATHEERCMLLVERRHLTNSDHDESEECVHRIFECKFCKSPLTAISEENHLSVECMFNFVTCELCKNDVIPKQNLEKHQSNCIKTGKLQCPAHEIGCPWVGYNEPSLEIHLSNGNCPLNLLLPFIKGLESKVENLSEENSSLQRQIHKILDSIIQGKVTNLGYSEPIEEIGSFTRDLGRMEDQDKLLHLNYEIDRLKSELEERVNPFIERETSGTSERENVMNGLVSDNFIMKDDLNLQRALINSLRKQVQFLLFRNRNPMFGASGMGNPTFNGDVDEFATEIHSRSSSEERLNLKL